MHGISENISKSAAVVDNSRDWLHFFFFFFAFFLCVYLKWELGMGGRGWIGWARMDGGGRECWKQGACVRES